MSGMKSRVLSAVAGVAAASCSAGPAQVPVAGAEHSPAPAPTVGATCGIADFQASLLARINEARARGARCGSEGRFGPAPPLAWNGALARAAAAHSRDMASHDLFSHTGSNGSVLRSRVDAAGYRWRSIAENIAGGRDTTRGVVDQWVTSPGHCANLMNPRFVHVGVACAPGGPRSTYTHYWTMTLGTPARP